MANILVIDQYAEMGGAQRILVDLVVAFQRDGHQVTALFPGPGPVRELLSGAQSGDYYLPSLRSGKKNFGEKLRYFALARRSAQSIEAHGAGNRFDLIYVNGPRAMLPSILAAKSLGIPVVAAVHLIHDGAERRLLEWCFRRPAVRLVTFCSRYAAEPFSRIGSKGRILPNWVAPQFLDSPSRRLDARARLAIGNDEIAIGVFGRVSKTKGQRLLIEAASPLLQSHPNVKLLIAGGADFEDPQEESDLKSDAARHGGRIRFLEKMDAVDFLDSLDISVVPSIRPESFGLVAIESMARRLAVVASRRGGLMDSVVDGQTGYLVETEIDPMREALERLIEDKALREKMGETGRERVETEFSPEIRIPITMRTILEAAR